MFKKLNDPVSSISHCIGAISAIPITIALALYGAYTGTTLDVVAYLIFGLSLFSLYTSSTIYHLIPKKDSTQNVKQKARRVDHMMIYILIAGTYTPVCLISLNGVLGYTIIAIIWGIALLGVIFKLFVLNDSKVIRWISTGLYLVMGWFVLVVIYPVTKSVDTITLVLMALGGVSYTVGAVIYALKKPAIPVEWLDFHDIFHFFVLLGSLFHVLMMFTL